MKRTICVILGGMLVSAATALTGYTATVLEYDYQNVNNTTHQVNASAVKAGASGLGQLTTNSSGTYATVNTGSAINTNVVSPSLQYGFLSALGGDARGLTLVESSGGAADNQWADYAGAASFRTGTVQIVFQPNSSGAQLSRRGLFAHHVGFTDEAWFFRGSFGGSGDSLHFRTKGTGGPIVSLASPVWDSNAWYFISISWALGAEPTVFWRVIEDGSGAIAPGVGNFAIGSTALTEGAGFTTAPAIAVRPDLSENMDGRTAYFLWTDQYTSTAAGYQALFALIVPEPSTSLLLAAAGLLLVGRKRTHA